MQSKSYCNAIRPTQVPSLPKICIDFEKRVNDSNDDSKLVSSTAAQLRIDLLSHNDRGLWLSIVRLPASVNEPGIVLATDIYEKNRFLNALKRHYSFQFTSVSYLWPPKNISRSFGRE